MRPIADMIKDLRARGLTQTEISKRTGIPQPRLSRWENGRAPVGADDALKLHALLVGTEAAPEASAMENVGQ